MAAWGHIKTVEQAFEIVPKICSQMNFCGENDVFVSRDDSQFPFLDIKGDYLIPNDDGSWTAVMVTYHPGSFNPYDGGTPPETSEIEMEAPTVVDALRKLIMSRTEQLFNDIALDVCTPYYD